MCLFVCSSVVNSDPLALRRCDWFVWVCVNRPCSHVSCHVLMNVSPFLPLWAVFWSPRPALSSSFLSESIMLKKTNNTKGQDTPGCHGDLCCCCLHTCSLKRQSAAGYSIQRKAAVSRYPTGFPVESALGRLHAALHHKPSPSNLFLSVSRSFKAPVCFSQMALLDLKTVGRPSCLLPPAALCPCSSVWCHLREAYWGLHVDPADPDGTCSSD